MTIPWHIANNNTNYLVPPATSTFYPWAVPSGEVGLFQDAAWSGNEFWIKTAQYTEKVQASLIGVQQDATTWVVFNLPVGTVLTLLQSVTAPVPGQPYNFANAGSSVDLIGNGMVQTVDLREVYANDCISAFVWRRVDHQAGIFQLFEGTDWSGLGATFFLAEWPASEIHSLWDWAMCDWASSMYFGGLGVGEVTLYDGAQGEGQSVQLAGWLEGVGPNGMGVNLVDRGFSDVAASWKWSPRPPIYQVVNPFTVPVTIPVDDSLGVVMNTSGSNAGSSTVQQTAKFTYTISQTATVTVTHTRMETYTTMVGFKFGATLGIGSVANMTFEGKLDFTFNEQFTETIAETETTTQTLVAELDQVLNVPANSNWTSALLLQYGKVEPTNFTTTAKYYYDEPVPGSVPDPAMAAQLGYATLYVLDTTISGYIEAALSLNALSTVMTTPMGSATPTTVTSVIDTVLVP